MGRQEATFWYAMKVFYNRAPLVQEELMGMHFDTYLPTMIVEKEVNGQTEHFERPIIASLLFVKCPERFLIDYKREHGDYMLYYTEAGTGKPGKIDNDQMENFRLATSIENPDIMYLGPDDGTLSEGDKVIVTDGLYKGRIGYIKRIKHARRFLVKIDGIAVVAISHIHPQYLKKYEPETGS